MLIQYLIGLNQREGLNRVNTTRTQTVAGTQLNTTVSTVDNLGLKYILPLTQDLRELIHR